jgi:diguanylate cyclase (GGDEF)-like protein
MMDGSRGKSPELDRTRAELKHALKRAEEQARRVRELEEQISQAATQTAPAPLDSVPDRRAFDEAFRVEQSRAKRDRAALSLVLLQIDEIEAITDLMGHSAGEAANSHLAITLRTKVRPTDVVARLEGLEFGLLLTATTLEQALAATGRLQGEFTAQPMELSGRSCGLTFSAGVVQWREEETLGDLLSRASRALNQARRGGINKVVVA